MLTYYRNNIKPRHWWVQIAANSLTRYIINTRVPTYITNIIGIMTLGRGVGPNNVALVPVADTDLYYLFLKDVHGGAIYDNIRYTTLHYASNNEVGPYAFLPTNIIGKELDLVNSYVLNPSGASNSLFIGFLYV